MKILLIIGLVCLASFTTFAQTNNQPTTVNTTTVTAQTYTRPKADDRFKKYLNQTFGPTAFIGPVFSSTFRQIRNKPEEWQKNSKGFAKRFGDSFGRNVIRQSITYGIDEALKLDSNYYKSSKKDFKSRFSNAVISTFTARNERGKRIIGIPSIVGTYSAAFIANETWMPKRFNYKNSLRDGTVSLGTRIGINLLREFVFK